MHQILKFSLSLRSETIRQERKVLIQPVVVTGVSAPKKRRQLIRSKLGDRKGNLRVGLRFSRYA